MRLTAGSIQLRPTSVTPADLDKLRELRGSLRKLDERFTVEARQFISARGSTTTELVDTG